MEKFQITNDLSVFWSITEKDGSPYRLSDKTVRVFVTHPRGRMDVTDEVTIQDNVISWLFRGSRQRYLGTYQLTAEIQATPADRIVKRDIPEAFALVSSSQYEQTEKRDPDINDSGRLTLSTSLDVFHIQPIIPQIGPNGNWWVDGADTGIPATGIKFAIERTVYLTENGTGDHKATFEISEEERAYNRQTFEMARNDQPVFISLNGAFAPVVTSGHQRVVFNIVADVGEASAPTLISNYLTIYPNGDATATLCFVQAGGVDISLRDEVLKNEEVYAAAVNDLNTRMIETNAALSTEVSTREKLSSDAQELTARVASNEEVTSVSYNDLNTRIESNRQHSENTYATKNALAEAVASINTIIAENEEVIAATLNDLLARINTLATKVEQLENA